MPNDNTSLDLLAAYMGKKPEHLLKNRPFRNAILKLIYANGGGGGGGAVSSVFTRTGDVVASTGDYTFAQIGSTPTSVAGYGITDAVSLTGTQTLTNKTLTAPTLTAPVLGTPASGNLSNCTNLPLGSVTGLGTGVATFLTTPSSANLISAVTDETGTGALVFAGSPTFTGTPTLPTGTIATTQTAGNSTTAIATTAFATTADNLKANIASPTFTGTPAAPTAAALTNTTQLATTAFAMANAGCVFLATGSAAATATMSVSLVSFFNLYRALEIRFYNVRPATDNTNLLVRVSVDGTTYNSGAAAYSYTFAVGSVATTATGTSVEIGSGFSNASTAQSSGNLIIYNQNQATTFPTVQGNLQGTASGGTSIFPIMFAGQLTTAQLTKGIQFLFSSGNITGTWALYGYN